MNPLPNRLTPQTLAQLGGGKSSIKLFEHGSLQIEIYRPFGVDRQAPHTRDEVYVVMSGSGFFECGGERRPFAPGEVLFVPAGVEHRFDEFTVDFAAWVFFYGPEGGEAGADPAP
jgi:hypothetical protein